ncbi:MAG: hypothetical protein ACON5B_09295 [Myxococcota bacterium]
MSHAVPLMLVWHLAVCLRPPRVTFGSLMAAAVLCRLAFLGGDPLLSDDVYRYVVEGNLLNHGGNPFITAPSHADAGLEHLTPHVNHSDMTSIYPPGATYLFSLIARVPAPSTFQAFCIVADLAVVSLWWTQGHRSAAIIWALHPLVIVESAHNGHLESIAVAMAASAAVLPPSWRAGLTTLAAGTKLLPILWLPRVLHGRTSIGGALIAVGLLATVSGPLIEAGMSGGSSLAAYTAHWSFNGALFGLLNPWFHTATRPVLMGLGLVAVCGAWARAPSALHTWLWCALAFVLLSPTAHPWYALWLLAPAALLQRTALMLTAGWLLAGYGVLSSLAHGGSWHEPDGLWAATWLPIAGVLLYDLRAAKRSSAPRHDTQVNPVANNTMKGTLPQ